MHIKRLLFACISFLVALPFVSRDIAVRLADGWPAYHPSPGVSIALDAATREHADARQPGIMSRFAEFVRRALTHNEFTAGHYDPGWRPA